MLSPGGLVANIASVFRQRLELSCIHSEGAGVVPRTLLTDQGTPSGVTRKIIFVLTAALLLGFCFWESSPAPKSSILLAELVTQANSGPILGPAGLLGSFPCTPYLQEGWGALTGDEFRSTQVGLGGERGAVVRFYLTQKIAISIDLEGRDLAGPSTTVLSLLTGSSAGQSELLGKLSLTGDWTRQTVEVPADRLREGINELSLSAPRVTQWRLCRIIVRNSNSDGSAVVQGGEHVGVSFGHSLEFPLLLQPASQLVIDDVRPRIEPGAPSLDTKWDLAVRIQSGAPATLIDRTWHLDADGFQKIALPIDRPTEVTLSIVATCSAKPVTGQTGLQLRNPRIESPSATPSSRSVRESPVFSKPAGTPEKSRPNILLYVVDTLRADHIRCYGSVRSITPHFDALSKDGILFTDCMAQSSWTKAAVASIMTSLPPQDHGAQDFPDSLASSFPTLAQELARAGYDNRGIVANPFVARSFGFASGFAGYEELLESDAHRLTKAASSWLAKRTNDKPFFLYIHALDPHLPYSPPLRYRPADAPVSFGVEDMKNLREEWASRGADAGMQKRAREAIALYDGEIRSCDAAFGGLISRLKSLNLYENTMIILVSDHGEQFFEHGLCDHMNSLYQELLHVPLIIKFPQEEGAGSVTRSTWEHIDITPTILRRAGLEIPLGMQGRAYAPGDSEARGERPEFFSLHVGSMAARYHQGEGFARADMEGVRVGPWVLNRIDSTIADVPPIQLFQLDSDPAERQDLTFRRPEVRTWLQSLLNFRSRREDKVAPEVSREVVRKSLRALPYLQ